MQLQSAGPKPRERQSPDWRLLKPANQEIGVPGPDGAFARCDVMKNRQPFLRQDKRDASATKSSAAIFEVSHDIVHGIAYPRKFETVLG